jgi:hypothetical protein
MLSSAEVTSLLSKLCLELGFCLPPEDCERLRQASPSDVDAFTDAVFVAEGLAPDTADGHLYKQVRARISDAFHRHITWPNCMSDRPIKERWVMGESASRLTSMLGLPFLGDMQDWQYVCGDSHRLGEFLDVYERGGLSDDDRFALMALIVSSLDDWIQAGGTDAAVLERVRRHLVADLDLHEYTVHYWCVLEELDLENVFHVTPFMREIWSQRG